MRVFIIAEAGVNHNGSIKIAKKLIDSACQAGADAIKFQTFKAKNIATKKSEKANYQKQLEDKNDSQFKMLKRLELDYQAHINLIKYCKSKKIKFLSSPFDIESVKFLNNIGLKIFKIPSGEITNLPYLRQIGKLKKKIILSTGMSKISDIKNAIYYLVQSGTHNKNITLLHTNSEYPTPMQDVNLRAMLTIGKKFNVKFGYSDHTLGIEVSIAAVAMGASCIEKHITLDRKMEGPDHKSSLEPNELELMINSIRNIELALGEGQKKPSKSELKNINLVRKSIVANKKIKKGEILNEINISTKRPGYGISPMKWDKIIGTKAKKNYNKDDLI